MATNTKRTVSFTVAREEYKEELEEIAIMKGYLNLSAMARVAVFQYINRYKLAQRLAVQRQRKGGEIPEILEIVGAE